MGLIGFRITFSAPIAPAPDQIGGVILERADLPDSGWTEVARESGVPTCIWDRSAGFGIRRYYRVRFFQEVRGAFVLGAPSSIVSGLEMDWTSGAEITLQRTDYPAGGDSTALLVVTVPAGPWISSWVFRSGIGESIYYRSGFETANPPADRMQDETIGLSDFAFWESRLARDLSLFAAFCEQYGRRSILIYRKGGRI